MNSVRHAGMGDISFVGSCTALFMHALPVLSHHLHARTLNSLHKLFDMRTLGLLPHKQMERRPLK